jgi:hypothetical protein
VSRDLVLKTQHGTELDAHRPTDDPHCRRQGRLSEKDWTPRELRHSFVSLLSSSGVSIEDILHLVGRASTNMTGSCDAPA